MPVYRVLLAVGRPLLTAAFRPRVAGTANVPREGGIVVCPTHLSGFDVLAVAWALAPRMPRNMAKNELFGPPLLRRFVRSLGAFPARDDRRDRGGVAAAAALAAAGEAVVIFPEGARRRGRVRRPRRGAAQAALIAGVPVVPTALRGTDGWRRLERWRIAFGEPLRLDDLAGLELAAASREATGRMWACLRELEAGLDTP